MYCDSREERVVFFQFQFTSRSLLVFLSRVAARRFAFFASFGALKSNRDSVCLFSHLGLLLRNCRPRQASFLARENRE